MEREVGGILAPTPGLCIFLASLPFLRVNAGNRGFLVVWLLLVVVTVSWWWLRGSQRMAYNSEWHRYLLFYGSDCCSC
jgi:hypothetical protein